MIEPVFPNTSPKLLFRDRGDCALATRSPIPASPKKVRGLAPYASPNLATSANPRVIINP